MKELKIYKNLYYISFLITLICMIIIGIKMDELSVLTVSPLFIINLVLVILFVILNSKFKLKKQNKLCPVIYLVFLSIVVILSFIINPLLMLQNVHYMYYFNFVLIGYLILNIYSLLCLSK